MGLVNRWRRARLSDGGEQSVIVLVTARRCLVVTGFVNYKKVYEVVRL